MSAVERINHFSDSVVEVIEHTAAALAIPVADGVVSWLAAENMVRTLRFSWPVSIMTGVALEGCGIVVSRAALVVRHYNQTRPENDPAALEWMAWALLVVQFIVGAVLVTVNTVATSSMLFGLLTLATLSAVGTLAHMLENDVKARQSGANHVSMPIKDAQSANNTCKVADKSGVNADLASTRDRVRAYYMENPHARQEDVGEALGVSRQTVSHWRKELLAVGAIPPNGNGRH